MSKDEHVVEEIEDIVELLKELDDEEAVAFLSVMTSLVMERLDASTLKFQDDKYLFTIEELVNGGFH